MKVKKNKKLLSKGWKVGTIVELFNLSVVESAYIELKLIMSKDLLKKFNKKGN